MRRLILGAWTALILGLLMLAAVALWARYELTAPDDVVHETYFEIPPGTAYQTVLRQLVDSGRLNWRSAFWLRVEARIMEAPEVKAGEYRIPPEQTPYEIRELLVSGDVILHRIQFVEGWTTQQAVAAVRAHPAVVHVLEEEALSLDKLMPALGLESAWAEGRFRPDTYAFPKGTTDRSVLRRAALAQEAEVERWWALRPDDLPIDTPEEMLILASIIEKETGVPEERFEVAGVFINRLRLGMKLQTDPTVAYGVAPDFNGRLLRRHLDTDTPFNTYTREGLPPTAICLPGSASLQAVVQPATTENLFFVARGDGTGGHVFSKTLAQHNAAVQRYREVMRSRAAGQALPTNSVSPTPIPAPIPTTSPTPEATKSP